MILKALKSGQNWTCTQLQKINFWHHSSPFLIWWVGVLGPEICSYTPWPPPPKKGGGGLWVGCVISSALLSSFPQILCVFCVHSPVLVFCFSLFHISAFHSIYVATQIYVFPFCQLAHLFLVVCSLVWLISPSVLFALLAFLFSIQPLACSSALPQIRPSLPGSPFLPRTILLPFSSLVFWLPGYDLRLFSYIRLLDPWDPVHLAHDPLPRSQTLHIPVLLTLILCICIKASYFHFLLESAIGSFVHNLDTFQVADTYF